MEAPSLSSQLRHRLRATVCCCFGQQGASLGERMRWTRRAGVGEFRYDPLSYALNFDEGADDVEVEEEGEEGVYGAARGDAFYQSFSSRLPTPSPALEVA